MLEWEDCALQFLRDLDLVEEEEHEQGNKNVADFLNAPFSSSLVFLQ